MLLLSVTRVLIACVLVSHVLIARVHDAAAALLLYDARVHGECRA